MELDEALPTARGTHRSILTTIKRDGRPQLSNVMHAVDDTGLVRISTTADRAKAHNLRREPWAALHVTGPTFFSYVVLEGEAEVSAVAAEPDDTVVEELVAVYREIGGEHDDWDAYRRSMVEDRRLVIRFRPARAYGVVPPPGGSQ